LTPVLAKHHRPKVRFVKKKLLHIFVLFIFDSSVLFYNCRFHCELVYFLHLC
jgi:hypothetical protein